MSCSFGSGGGVGVGEVAGGGGLRGVAVVMREEGLGLMKMMNMR